VAGTFSWNDKRTLAQIEQMTGYSVKPRGVVSHFKNGGYVVYEKDGHGLVISVADLGNFTWDGARNACYDLILNGYSDWRLPSLEELKIIFNNCYKAGVFNLSPSVYWGAVADNSDSRHAFNFLIGETDGSYRYPTLRVRAVRSF
jgi:hypothetical protein